MPLHPSSGDGSPSNLPPRLVSGLPSGDGAAGVPPGQLVVTAVVLAADVARGPRLPLYLDRVAAGFPSPADDYVEGHLDLHELTGAGSPSCYFLRVTGESMTGAGIHDGDVLVVDRAATPASGAVVVASVDGELTVKRYAVHAGRAVLLAAHPAYPPIELAEGQELVVWGVVTHSLRDHRARRLPAG